MDRPPNELDPACSSKFRRKTIPITANDPGATDQRQFGCNLVQQIKVAPSHDPDSVVEVDRAQMKATMANNTNTSQPGSSKKKFAQVVSAASRHRDTNVISRANCHAG